MPAPNLTPYTPPGTSLVCIDDLPGAFGEWSNLRLWGHYTLEAIWWSPRDFGDWTCTLEGLPGLFWHLSRFRVAELPSSIRELALYPRLRSQETP